MVSWSAVCAVNWALACRGTGHGCDTARACRGNQHMPRQLRQERGRGNYHKNQATITSHHKSNLEIQGIQIARPPAALRACWGGRRSIMMLRHIRLGIKSTWLGSGGRLLRGARNKLAPRLPRRQAPWKVGMHVSHASSQSCPVKCPCVGRVA